MKPIKLVIQAFGPFAQTETINFSDLGENPLFLINGPTGAGKSSILDAICFALYGQTTGKEREAGHMRCDFSANDLLTKITLTFSLGAHYYRVERIPTQDRPKTKGEGFTTQQTTAHIYKLAHENNNDEDILLEAKLANKTTAIIEGLTGLNVEQFRQVMVLPQGKFREFLMADSASRESIFSKLFQTQIYKQIEDSLKERSAGIRKEVEKLQQHVKGILDSADLTSEDELSDNISAVDTELNAALINKNERQKLWLFAEKNLQKSAIINKSFDDLASLKENRTSLKNEQASIDENIQQLSQARKATAIEAIQQQVLHQSNQLKAISSELKINTDARKLLETNKDEAQVLFNASKVKTEGLDKEKIEYENLMALLPKLEALKQASITFITAQKNDKKHQLAVSKIQGNIQTNKDAINAHTLSITQAQESLIQLPKQQQIVDELKRFGMIRSDLDKKIQESALISQQVSEKEESLKQLKEKTHLHDISYKTIELKWHNMQASILAAELQQAMPCPVCGSKEHPLPAIKTHETVTKDDIEKARAIVLKLTQEQAPIQAEIAGLIAHNENISAAVSDIRKELGGSQGAYLQQTTDELREQYKQANAQLKSLFNLQEQQVTQQKTLQRLQTELTKDDSLLEQEKNHAQQASQALTIANERQQTLEVNVPDAYRNSDELDKAITVKKSYISNVINAHQQYEQAFNLAIKTFENNQSTIKQQKIQLDQEQSESINVSNRWQQALQDQGFFKEQSTTLADAEINFKHSLMSDEKQQELHALINAYQHKVSKVDATINQQEQQLEGCVVVDIQALEVIQEKEKELNEEAIELWSQHDKRQQQLLSIQNKLNTAKNNSRELEENYKVIGTLSDVANGQTGDKISLQRFVLSVLLDDVLSEASQRLQVMSKGRYQLLRK
ncbi:MAG: SMC family ATPase, partial [Sinobacterium sp.]|nr:SMC family ATPase [Sinobacterium sp.]